MKITDLSREQFPVIYEQGQPVAVVLDLDTFQRLIDAITRLQAFEEDAQESAWILKVIQEAKVYRAENSAEVVTLNTPEAILAELDSSDD